MIKYKMPEIYIKHFKNTISTTEDPVTASGDYIYAAEMANNFSFSKYLSERATTTKIQNVLDFN